MATTNRQPTAAMTVTGSGMRMAVRVLRDGGGQLSGRDVSGARTGADSRMPNGDPAPLTLWGADEGNGPRRL